MRERIGKAFSRAREGAYAAAGSIAARDPKGYVDTLRLLNRDLAAQMGIMGTIMTVAAGAVALFIVLLVIGQVKDSLPTTVTCESTYSTIVSNTNNAIILVAVGLIVVGASFILSTLFGGLWGGLGGGGRGGE